MGRRAALTKAQVKRMVEAAREVDPRAVVEIVTDAGIVRIMPEPSSVAPIEDRPHDGRKPIPWT